MKLINADELMEMLRAYKHCPFGLSIDEIPTVDAIPVKWIEMFIQRYKIQGGDEYKLLHFMITEWKRWEKENEAD